MLLTFYPVLNCVYWPQVFRSGGLTSDGDSILAMIVGSPLLLIVFGIFAAGCMGSSDRSGQRIRRVNPAIYHIFAPLICAAHFGGVTLWKARTLSGPAGRVGISGMGCFRRQP